MNLKLSKICLGMAASLVSLAVISFASAQQPDNQLISSGTGGAVKDPFGNCVHTMGGTIIPECNPVVIAEPIPAPIFVSLGADTTFEFDRSELRPAGRAALDDLVAKINQAERVDGIDIVGHTDAVGSEQYNQGLSERRAVSVKEFLVARGIDRNIITARGESFRQPIATNETPGGRAQNRRVEVTVDAKKVPQGR